MLKLNYKFLFKFVTLGLMFITASVAGIYGADRILIQNVDYAKAAGETMYSPTPTPTPSPSTTPQTNFNCEPGIQKAWVSETVSFRTTSNDSVGWNAPGGSPSSGNGNSFQTKYNDPGNYRVWADDNDTSCFIHVVKKDDDNDDKDKKDKDDRKNDDRNDNDKKDKDRKDNDHPKYPVYKVYFPMNHPNDDRRNYPDYTNNPNYAQPTPDTTAQNYNPQPSYQPIPIPDPTSNPQPDINCPAGWNKETHGPATVCIPGNQMNQNQDQNQNQNQNQNQSQNNNQNQNVNTNVVVSGGNSSSSSSSSSSNSVNINID